MQDEIGEALVTLVNNLWRILKAEDRRLEARQ